MLTWQLSDDGRRAARLVAHDLLDRIRAARSRLTDPEDADALHDFRVAVRRLRSWLGVQDALPTPMLPKRAAKWLRRLAKATNPSRDDEVFAMWVESQRRSLPARQRAAVAWCLQRIGAHRAAAVDALTREIDRDLDRLVTLLEERLSRYEVTVHVQRGPIQDAFALTLAAVLQADVAALRRRLALIRSADDAAAIHRARISGKRLRYRLEPIAALVPGASEALVGLKTLQDLLGEHHDAHLWATTLTQVLPAAATPPIRAGVEALCARARAREAERYAVIASEWTSGEPPLLARLEAIGADLAAAARSGVEVERKFLLRGVPLAMPTARVQQIAQGYLPGSQLIERVRKVREGRSTRYLRTVKAGAGVTRLEAEEACSATLFRALWPLTDGRRVTKRRYLVADGSMEWAVDVFTDRALVLAEVELPHADADVVFPAWLVDALEREVTDDPAFVNAVLAR